MNATANLLFVGLPGSGKTTFLAALWHVLEDRSSETSLKLKDLSVDRAYLNQITADWRACSQVQRTKLEPEELVVLSLASAAGTTFELTVPDLSGEAFEQQIVDRRMAVSHQENIRRATGFVFFVHPGVKEGTQLTYSRRLQAVIEGTPSSLPNGAGGDGGRSGIEPWSIEKLPTQVKVVELLQFALERALQKVRIAVVISAWDLVESTTTLAPHEYLAREMPLLRQFLDSNSDLLDHAVFGVSAQGGDITVDEQKQALLELDDALMRIKVRHGADTSQDITMPIAWLLEER
ncbi:TRAFAC clade GTPase domain-containing protein [Corallococcus exiguus]|uniref:TRAFAC clade GTPase domain-containing protein n=1 Tax=Corallococcus exiguus TaxID=83462 RepID=UPI003DA1E630